MKYFRLLILALFCLCSVSHVCAWDQAEAVAFWEAQQKNYFGADHFKKLSDGSYDVKFSAFPYEGKLRVVGLDVYPEFSTFPEAKASHEAIYITTDLSDLSDVDREKYSDAIKRWDGYFNTLYVDLKSSKWQNSTQYEWSRREDWQDEMHDFSGQKSGALSAKESQDHWMTVFIAVLFVLLVIYLMIRGMMLTKKSFKHSQTILDRQKENAELQRQTNETMRALIDALKQNKDQ